MGVYITLDVMLAKRKMQSKDIAKAIGVTPRNFSLLKTGKVKAIRLTTLARLCKILNCQPNDILEYVEEDDD